MAEGPFADYLEATSTPTPAAPAGGRTELAAPQGPFADYLEATGNPSWHDQGIPLHERVGGYLQSQARQRQSWEDVGPQVKARFGVDPAKLQQQYGLETERVKQAGEDESTLEYFARRSGPLGSAVGNWARAKRYQSAVTRFQAGTASQEDLEKIARYERLQEIDRQTESTTGGAIRSSLASIPAIVGEAYAGGAALRGLGVAAGAGGPAAAATRPALLTSAGLRSVAAATATKAGLTAAQTAVMPSMYLAQGAQNAIDAPDRSTFRSYGAAFGVGAMQTAVLGSLSRFANRIPGNDLGARLQRLGERTGIGMVEQQAVDVLAGATGLQAGYGIGGDLLQGKNGDALKHATVQAVTFGAFAAMHGGPGAEKPVLDSYFTAVQALAKKGVPAHAAGEQASAISDRFSEAVAKNPNLTPDGARDLFKDVPAGPLKDYAHSLADTIKKPATPPPQPEQAPAEQALTEGAPVDPVQVLGETAVRNLARSRGFDGNAPIDTLLERIGKNPAAKAKLDGLVAEKRMDLKPPDRIPSLAGPIEPKKEPVAEPKEPTAEPTPTAPEPAEGQSAAAADRPKVGDVTLGPPRKAKTYSGAEVAHHEILDSTGKAIGDLRIIPSGRTLNIDWVGMKGAAGGEAAGKLGNAQIIRLARQLADAYPDAILLRGARAGGIHKGFTRDIDLTKFRRATAPPEPPPPLSPLERLRQAQARRGTVTAPKPADTSGNKSPVEQIIPGEESIIPQDFHGVLGAAGLTPEERHVIEQRSQAEKYPSLRALGKDMGVSYEQVRQLEKKALAKIAALSGGKFSASVDKIRTELGKRGAAEHAEQAAGGEGPTEEPAGRKGAFRNQQVREAVQDRQGDTILEADRATEAALADPTLENSERLAKAIGDLRDVARKVGMHPYELFKSSMTKLHDLLGEDHARELITTLSEDHDASEAAKRDAKRWGLSPASLRRFISSRLQGTPENAQVPAAGEAAQGPGPLVDRGPAAGGGKSARNVVKGESPQQVAIRFGGIDPRDASLLAHVSGANEARQYGLNVPGLFRHGGRGLDQLAQELHTQGYIRNADPQTLLDWLKSGRAPSVEEALAGQRPVGEGATSGYEAKLNDFYRSKEEHENAKREAARAGENATSIEESASDGQADAHEEVGRTEGDDAFGANARSEDAGPGDRGGVAAGGETPGVFFHKAGPGGQPGTGPPAGGPGKPIGPFEIIKTAEELLGPKRYVEKQVPYDPAASAAYLQDPRAIVTGKMAAGDAAIDMHERAHDIATEHKLETNPAVLGPDISRGFQQFDYNPNRPMGRTAIMEGFAEWFRKRQTDQLGGMTPEQAKADAYGEKFLKDAGLTAKVDRIRDQFRRFGAQTAAQKAAGLVSATGRTALPEQTRGERVSSLAQATGERFQDEVDTNLGSLHRLETAAESRGKKFAPGERPSTVYGQLMFGDKTRAGEFEREGIHTLIDGKKMVIGPSLDKITSSLKPEDLSATTNGVSRAELYALGKHILGEFDRGRKPVPDEQRKMWEAAMTEFAADPEFVKRADAFATQLTAANLASRRALASKDVHFLSHAQVADLGEKYPDYAELARVLSDAGWRTSAGARGEKVPSLLHARSGSGEQIVAPLVSYKKRMLVTAAVMNEQLRRNALFPVLLHNGMGDWAVAGEEAGPTERGKIAGEVLEKLGMTDPEVAAVLRQLNAANYFYHEPWPQDGAKPTLWWKGPDGQLTNVRVGDRALYDLATGQQVEAHQFASLVKAFANFGFEVPGLGRVQPISFSTKVVKTGATGLSLGFQVRNIARDAYEFWKNTIDRATVGGLPDAYRRAYQFAWAELRKPFTGKASSDVLFQRFADARGDELRALAFDKNLPESTYDKLRQKGRLVRAYLGGAELLKNVLNLAGAGELAPRFREFKTRLEQLGWTESRIVAEEKAARQAEALGQPYLDPVPFHLQLDAMQHAAEVTVPFQRQGVVTREINKITPFFGPAVAGMSKAVRNWRTNTKGAAYGMAALLGMRLMHWIMFHDEDWHSELSANDRFNNFVVPIPGLGLRRLPGPRDLEIPAGGFLTTMLDAAAGRRPDFAGLAQQSVEAVAPPVPVPPVGKVAWELRGNKSWMGTPIVPRRDQDMPAGYNATEHQIPYAAQQLSGGRADVSVRGAGVVPFTEVRNARASVDRLFDRVHDMEAERLLATRKGLRYADEREYQKAHAATLRIKEMSRELRGEKKVGTRVVAGAEPDDGRKEEIKRRMVEVARAALAGH